jgi:hypothetical protein
MDHQSSTGCPLVNKTVLHGLVSIQCDVHRFLPGRSMTMILFLAPMTHYAVLYALLEACDRTILT